MLNFPSDRIEFVIEMQIHVFTKSTAVVIAIRSTVPEGFENDVRLDENVTDSEWRGKSEVNENLGEEVLRTVEFLLDWRRWSPLRCNEGLFSMLRFCLSRILLIN